MTENDIDEGIQNYRGSSRLTGAERIAIEYSHLMATDPEKVGREFYEQLRLHYSDAEIVELGTFIGFNIGFHTFFGTLKFYPMFSPDGRLVDQAESERIYGAAPGSLASGVGA